MSGWRIVGSLPQTVATEQVRDFDARQPGGDVPDPIGQGPGAYEEVARCLDSALEGVLGYVQQARE